MLHNRKKQVQHKFCLFLVDARSGGENEFNKKQ